ncbi:MAG: glycosyltransferase family 4 protein [Nitrospirae bacterium]|nr:glycosyltransferase family 4 protein [Nitrospirota bacterium]
MRVLHLVKTATGATWALHQMRELVKMGVEVHVALPDGPLMGQYISAGVQTHICQLDVPPFDQWFLYPQVLKRLRSLVHQIKPDIVHSHFVGTTVSMRLALEPHLPIRRIFQVPGPLHLESPLYGAAEVRLSTSSDYWIGSCQWTCSKYLQMGIPANRIFLSYYGTDLQGFHGHSPESLRTLLNVASHERIVGMVAYMYPPKKHLGQFRGLKGHEDFIDALALCMKNHPEIVGVVIGGEWGTGRGYETQVRHYGFKKCGDRIHFLGTRNDAVPLYTGFDLAVHPSHSENVGGAVESFLLGIPTIATNVGGLPDLVKDRQTGWLIPSKSPARLADKILEALANPHAAAAMAEQGRALAQRLFDVRRTAKEVFDVYKQVL